MSSIVEIDFLQVNCGLLSIVCDKYFLFRKKIPIFKNKILDVKLLRQFVRNSKDDLHKC
jgi:hypothetical protein